MAKRKNPNIDIDNLSIDQLEDLKEDKLKENVIIPLLNEIGAENVIDMHGHHEHGIDVYFEWPDVFGHTRRFGIQVKAKKLRVRSRPDKNRSILEIMYQIKMAFGKTIPLYDSMHGKTDAHIDGFYIVNSKETSQVAKDFIYEERKTFPYIHIIDRDLLLAILKEKKQLKGRATKMRTPPKLLPRSLKNKILRNE